MSVATCTTVVGVFPDRRKADMAIDDLYGAGFQSSQIGVIVRDSAGNVVTSDTHAHDGEHAAEGGATGALVGAGLGGLVGLGVLSGFIPIVGPAIMAGTLGVIASNAMGGAAIAGLAGALIGWGIPEEDARYYEGELTAGRVIVTVNAEHRCDEARTILMSHGALSRDPESLVLDESTRRFD